MLLGGAVGFVFVAVQTAAAAIYASLKTGGEEAATEALLEALGSDGTFLAIATLVSAPLCTGLVVFFVKLRGSLSVREYLALRPITRREIILWVGASILAIVALDGLSLLLERPVMPEVIKATWRSADSKLLFAAAVVFGAPLFEEVFFRGFVLEGLRWSALGPAGAVVVTAVMWAGIHLQYDLYDIGRVFALGLLFGVARLRTKSLWAPLLMHSANNGLATLQVALYG